MPTTATPRLITPRQQRFVRSLADERIVPERHAADVLLATSGSLTARAASTLIDALMAAPRRGTTVTPRVQTGTPRSRTGEPTHAPSNSNRLGRMLNAGGAEATVTLADGRHVTVSIRTRARSGRGWTNANPGEGRTNISILGSRVGWVEVDSTTGVWELNLRTGRQEYIDAIKAIFDRAAGMGTDPVRIQRVQEASRCGRCFRTLTDPVSIDRGIGPECLGRVTNSRHVAPAPSADTITGREGDPTEADAANFASALNSVRTASERMADGMAQVAEATRAAAPVISEATRRVAAATNLTNDQKRARDLIAEALDAQCDERERDFAMSMFDQLAANAAS